MSSFRTGTTRRQVAQAHAQIALQHDPSVLVATALRTKSLHAREILAEAAWPGHSPTEIYIWSKDRSTPIIQHGMDIPWLGRFAQVVALQAIEADSFQLGRAVLERIVHAGRLAELPNHVVELLLQLRLAGRDRAAAEALLENTSVRPAQRDAVEADLLNPQLFSGLDDEGSWLAAFNRALRSPDIVDVTVEPQPPDSQVSVFDRLTTAPTQAIESDRFITVLMSCYRPGPALLTAVRSVIRQTWTNWELLIIDDASGPEYGAILESAAQLDPRVRVIRKALNGGTYRARNTALRQAAGEFCTVVDSDDWAHPQKLERLVQPMLEQPRLMATIGRGVRVNENLELNIPGILPRVPSAPSLMFRTLPVLSRIGFFDTTSKAADTEFRKRLELAFGARVHEVPQVLYFLRTGDTLSSSEISRGWKHPARRSYRKTYEAWHEKIVAASEDPFLDPDEGRKFPEPRRWAKPTAPELAPPPQLRVCVAGDWSAPGCGLQRLLDEVNVAREKGKTVAVMHLDALRSMARRDTPLVQPVMDLISSGVVEWIQPDDNLDVDVLVLLDPSVLQYPPTIGKPLRVSSVVIEVEPPPVAGREPDEMYCVDDVTNRGVELFGGTPIWQWQPHGADESAAVHRPSGPAPEVARTAELSRTVSRSRNRPVVEVGCDESAAAGTDRVGLDVNMARHYRVQRVPLRSLADAERNDEVIVAYRHGAEQALTEWLQQINDRHPAVARSQVLLDSVPEDVVLITTSCDGLTQLFSRYSICGDIDGADLLGLSGVDVPPAWSVAAWWTSARPRQVKLRE